MLHRFMLRVYLYDIQCFVRKKLIIYCLKTRSDKHKKLVNLVIVWSWDFCVAAPLSYSIVVLQVHVVVDDGHSPWELAQHARSLGEARGAWQSWGDWQTV